MLTWRSDSKFKRKSDAFWFIELGAGYIVTLIYIIIITADVFTDHEINHMNLMPAINARLLLEIKSSARVVRFAGINFADDMNQNFHFMNIKIPL